MTEWDTRAFAYRYLDYQALRRLDPPSWRFLTAHGGKSLRRGRSVLAARYEKTESRPRCVNTAI